VRRAVPDCALKFGGRDNVLILLMSIVNRCGINLEDAFRAKEARNESRVWI
jgi:hypothetical protein